MGRASIRDFHGSPVFTISPFSVLSSVIIMVTSYKSFQGLLWPNLSLLPSQRPQLIILSLRPFLVFSSVYVEIGSHLFFIYNSFFFIFFTSSSPSLVLCVWFFIHRPTLNISLIVKGPDQVHKWTTTRTTRRLFLCAIEAVEGKKNAKQS